MSPLTSHLLLCPFEVHTFALYVCVSISPLQIRLKVLTGRQAGGPQAAGENNVQVEDCFPLLCWQHLVLPERNFSQTSS